MKKFSAVLLFVGIVFGFVTDGSAAQEFSIPSPFSLGAPTAPYTAPNEESPHRAFKVFHKAPVGAYISVGTERGFMGAANSPNVTHLILVDYAGGIVAYNRMNVLLLKIAKNRADYLHLRLEANEAEWDRAVQGAGLDVADTAFMKREFKNWEMYVRNNNEFRNFHKKPTGLFSKFRKANYLFDDELFARIKGLADADRISVGLLDLTNAGAVQGLVNQLRESGVQLSVLDISNAWEKHYADRRKLATTLQEFDSVASDDSFFLATGQNLFPITLMFDTIIDRTLSPFTYTAYTFKTLRRYHNMKRFLDGLKWDWIFRFDSMRTKLDPFEAKVRLCLLNLISI